VYNNHVTQLKKPANGEYTGDLELTFLVFIHTQLLLGIDWSHVVTLGNLRAGLMAALDSMGFKVFQGRH
jgi:hypothetical protein